MMARGSKGMTGKLTRNGASGKEGNLEAPDSNGVQSHGIRQCETTWAAAYKASVEVDKK